MQPDKLSWKTLAACAAVVTAAALSPRADADLPPEGVNAPAARAARGERDATPRIRSAAKLMGTPIVNAQDEKIGKVEDLVVDLASSRVAAVVVSSGGFLGVGDQLSVVPSHVFRYEAERNQLRAALTREALAAAPRYRVGEEPDYASPGFTQGLSQELRRQRAAVDTEDPFEGSPAPDNTARNVRDRNPGAPDPFDQSNAQPDIDLVAGIRRAVVSRDDLSTNAKNVKIITRDGRVLLRGPVQTAEERRAIGEIAERLAGRGQVMNRLEVAER